MWVHRRRHPRSASAAALASNTQREAAPPATRQPTRKFISWPALAMMTVGSVGYLGSAPATAVLGLASVFLYVLPALVFLVPVSLVAAELASGWPDGVFNWVSEGISAPVGLLAVWCQFAQTIFYYPALLAYVGSTLAYVIDQRLASNGVYTAASSSSSSGAACWSPRGPRARGHALLARHRDRHAHPRRDPPRPRRDLSGPGQPFGGAGGHPSHPAGVERARQHRPDRQQLLHLRGGRGQRRARQRTSQPGAGLSEVDLRRDRAGAGDLHRPDAGDLLGDPREADQLHRRRDAGLQQPS